MTKGMSHGPNSMNDPIELICTHTLFDAHFRQHIGIQLFDFVGFIIILHFPLQITVE